MSKIPWNTAEVILHIKTELVSQSEIRGKRSREGGREGGREVAVVCGEVVGTRAIAAVDVVVAVFSLSSSSLFSFSASSSSSSSSRGTGGRAGDGTAAAAVAAVLVRGGTLLLSDY